MPSSACSAATRVSGADVSAAIVSSRGTARSPITVSRATAPSRVSAFGEESSAMSASICLPEEALMTTALILQRVSTLSTAEAAEDAELLFPKQLRRLLRGSKSRFGALTAP